MLEKDRQEENQELRSSDAGSLLPVSVYEEENTKNQKARGQRAEGPEPRDEDERTQAPSKARSEGSLLPASVYEEENTKNQNGKRTTGRRPVRCGVNSLISLKGSKSFKGFSLRTRP